MKWKVVTLNKVVDKELDALDTTFKAKFTHIANMLEQFGPAEIGEPYCRYLGNKLWEIRMKARPGIARAIYITKKNRQLIVLHAFVKKTQKTPKKAIEIALKRLEETNV